MKPLILAIDTTHEIGSLALVAESGVIEEITLSAPTGFSHVLHGEIAALLQRNSLTVRDVACFAATSGPGSFTGVRVGLACVKGLAEALGRPAVAISNLRALAIFGAAPLRAVVMDARRGEVYGAVYDAAGALVAPETVALLTNWLQALPPGEIEIITFGTIPEFPESARATAAPDALAAAIGRLALESYLTGRAADPAALDANYVRRADAEMMWKEN